MIEDFSKVNILIFKNAGCTPCRKVEPVLRQLVSSNSSNLATLTIIDTDKEVDLARRFHIDKIPVIYFNDKLILTADETVSLINLDQSSNIELPFFEENEEILGNYSNFNTFFGSNSQSALFSRLFDEIIRYSADSNSPELMQRRLKFNMLAISQKTMSIEAFQSVTRSSVGDYVHIGVLQSIVTSILAISPRSSAYLYRVGCDLGRYSNVQSRFLQNFPKIMDDFDDDNKFRDILEGLAELYSSNSLGLPLYLASRSIAKPIDSKSALLTVYESAFCAHISPIDQPVCYLIAGEIAGLVEIIMGDSVSVVETKCFGLGDPFCQFEIELGKERDFTFINERVFLSETEKEKFQLCLETISKNMYSSSLFRKTLRSGFSDYVHISVLQQTMNGIKFSDPFFTTLLFYGGFHYGKFGADFAVIERLMKSMGDAELPIDFEDSLYVMRSYFNDPSIILSRWQGKVDLIFEDEETALLNVYESSIASGLNMKSSDFSLDVSLETTLCDFTAGFIQGRLSRICDENVKVTEVTCRGLGSKFCQFKIELD